MEVNYVYYDVVHPDFATLTNLLDNELSEKNGDFQVVYGQYNQIIGISDFIVAYTDKRPIACASMKYFDAETYEIKRVYVSDHYRGAGIAAEMMRLIENKAKEKNIRYLIVETGKHLIPAINLYKKLSYALIENYGQYKDLPLSICFRKALF
jgi:GNAT superfamily N-acetyltransferase